MSINGSSSTLRKAIKIGKNMNLNLAPNVGDIVIRSKARLGRLSLAIDTENSKPTKLIRGSRLKALKKEYKELQDDLKQIIGLGE